MISEVMAMDDATRLSELMPGERAVVTQLRSEGGMRRRLLDLGLVEGTTVECVGRSAGGGISAYLIRGAVIAIRPEDSRDILVRGREKYGSD